MKETNKSTHNRTQKVYSNLVGLHLFNNFNRFTLCYKSLTSEIGFGDDIYIENIYIPENGVEEIKCQTEDSLFFFHRQWRVSVQNIALGPLIWR